MRDFKGTGGKWSRKMINGTSYVINEDNVLIAEVDKLYTYGFNQATGRAVDANLNLIITAPILLDLATLVFELSSMKRFPTEDELKSLADISKSAINKALGDGQL